MLYVYKKVRPNAPAENEVRIGRVTQESQGSKYMLRGAAEVETTDMLLRADEIDYDQDADYAEARGMSSSTTSPVASTLRPDRVEYHLDEHTGKFYEVKGSSPAKLEARPGVLTTTSPFSFEGRWAERLQDRYILHEGISPTASCRVRGGS